MIDDTRLRDLLTPFGLELSPAQAGQTLAYLELLLRWNRKINLTAIRDEADCVRRHFGESLFLAPRIEFRGTLLDIGSGAGFPGLALKIMFPELAVTLLEPVAKKRAFLKETARVCGFTAVNVRGDRLEDFTSTEPRPQFDFASMRAVGNLEILVPRAAKCLKPGGSLLLWLSQVQVPKLEDIKSDISWMAPRPIPLSRSTVVCQGQKT